jgi:hypothetical protein
MSDERWRHDPFAPPPPANALVGAVQPPVEQQADDSQDDDIKGLDRMSKAELVDLAKKNGVDPEGTRPQLIERLRG